MQKINIIILSIAVIVIGVFISIVKFIIIESKSRKISYSELFINMIKTLKYKKSTLVNNYPKYHGELECRDTEEYILFLDSGILQIIRKEEMNENG